MVNVPEKNKFSNYPQQPHGGKLVDQVVTGIEREEELVRAKTATNDYGRHGGCNNT